MQAEVQQALRLWGMGAAQAVLAARRENTVWRVVMGDQTYACGFTAPVIEPLLSCAASCTGCAASLWAG